MKIRKGFDDMISVIPLPKSEMTKQELVMFVIKDTE